MSDDCMLKTSFCISKFCLVYITLSYLCASIRDVSMS